MRRFLAGVVQVDTNSDYEQNLKIAAELVAEAAGRGAKFVSLPEVWAYKGPNPVQHAEDIPGGRCFGLLSELAKKHQIWIHGGSINEKAAGTDKKAYNTTMVIAPDGQLAAKYRKIHVFDVDVEGGNSFRESDTKIPGKDIVVYDTKELGTWGLSICYDMRFPELYRIMALEGAQILFAPASFLMQTGKDHWDHLLCARAIENSCYVIAAAQYGVKHDSIEYGKSMIVDPWGNIIAKASDHPCVITAEIDLDYLEHVRRQVLSLKNRRPDVYNLSRI